ncbi:MAG: response regulator, partial [Microcystaceae cyanobacterium]
LHGGDIQVTSVVDQGTCFTVTIPTGSDHLPSDRIGAVRTLEPTTLRAAPYVEEALRWLPEEGNSEFGIRNSELIASPSPPSLPRILLADDNADMRDYVKRLLSQCYEVEVVADGRAALAAVRQRPPDLLLTDVMMPGLDGFALLQELRAEPTTRELPIILLSARAGEEYRIEALKAGADDYLIKPFSARELLAHIEGNLKMAQLRQAATRQEAALRAEAEVARQQTINILESITDGFVAFDRRWCYTYVNQQAARLVNKTREEMLGNNIWELFPEAINTPFYEEFQRALDQQTSIAFEAFYAPLDSWFQVHAYPSPEGLSVYFRDVSEAKRNENIRQQKEERLRESQHVLQQVIDTIPGILYIYDLVEQRNLYVNRQIADLLGYTPEQIQAMGTQLFPQLLHPDDLAQLPAQLEQLTSLK